MYTDFLKGTKLQGEESETPEPYPEEIKDVQHIINLLYFLTQESVLNENAKIELSNLIIKFFCKNAGKIQNSHFNLAFGKGAVGLRLMMEQLHFDNSTIDLLKDMVLTQNTFMKEKLLDTVFNSFEYTHLTTDPISKLTTLLISFLNTNIDINLNKKNFNAENIARDEHLRTFGHYPSQSENPNSYQHYQRRVFQLDQENSYANGKKKKSDIYKFQNIVEKMINDYYRNFIAMLIDGYGRKIYMHLKEHSLIINENILNKIEFRLEIVSHFGVRQYKAMPFYRNENGEMEKVIVSDNWLSQLRDGEVNGTSPLGVEISWNFSSSPERMNSLFEPKSEEEQIKTLAKEFVFKTASNLIKVLLDLMLVLDAAKITEVSQKDLNQKLRIFVQKINSLKDFATYKDYYVIPDELFKYDENNEIIGINRGDLIRLLSFYIRYYGNLEIFDYENFKESFKKYFSDGWFKRQTNKQFETVQNRPSTVTRVAKLLTTFRKPNGQTAIFTADSEEQATSKDEMPSRIELLLDSLRVGASAKALNKKGFIYLATMPPLAVATHNYIAKTNRSDWLVIETRELKKNENSRGRVQIKSNQVQVSPEKIRFMNEQIVAVRPFLPPYAKVLNIKLIDSAGKDLSTKDYRVIYNQKSGLYLVELQNKLNILPPLSFIAEIEEPNKLPEKPQIIIDADKLILVESSLRKIGLTNLADKLVNLLEKKESIFLDQILDEVYKHMKYAIKGTEIPDSWNELKESLRSDPDSESVGSMIYGVSNRQEMLVVCLNAAMVGASIASQLTSEDNNFYFSSILPDTIVSQFTIPFGYRSFAKMGHSTTVGITNEGGRYERDLTPTTFASAGNKESGKLRSIIVNIWLRVLNNPNRAQEPLVEELIQPQDEIDSNELSELSTLQKNSNIVSIEKDLSKIKNDLPTSEGDFTIANLEEFNSSIHYIIDDVFEAIRLRGDDKDKELDPFSVIRFAKDEDIFEAMLKGSPKSSEGRMHPRRLVNELIRILDFAYNNPQQIQTSALADSFTMEGFKLIVRRMLEVTTNQYAQSVNNALNLYQALTDKWIKGLLSDQEYKRSEEQFKKEKGPLFEQNPDYIKAAGRLKQLVEQL